MNQSQLEKMVKDILKDANFSNVARPKAVKASASSASTQKTWGGKENAKASSSTQGSWDATNTPGGVSSFAKEVWTKDQIVALVREEVMKTLAFGNKPVPAPKTVSASTQPGYKSEPDKYGKLSASTMASYKKPEEYEYGKGKVSASTQSAWRKGGDGHDYTMCYHVGNGKTPKF